MPQMAPLWWEMLFIMFITVFIMMSVILYHNISPLQKESDATIQNTFNLNWKW
uniref:ATP synthase complex subunit 8 n=1 Tax=Macroscytus gibbulus TaxID=1316955 RepID=B7SME3_9HEMI|nr:ATP synthase F0 subunit 8 [Macroscytus gibbulus]ABZ02037.1 ATP synthase F0 subunit 8 [Macroscytus gibbulus]